MITSVNHPLVTQYLARLDECLKLLAPAQAVVLRAQIVSHIEEIVATGADDKQLASALSNLGPPESIVAEAIGDSPRPPRRGLVSIMARILLAVIVGLILLGASALLLAPAMGASVPPAAYGLAVLLDIACVLVIVRFVLRRRRQRAWQ